MLRKRFTGYFLFLTIFLCACAQALEKPESGGYSAADEGLFLPPVNIISEEEITKEEITDVEKTVDETDEDAETPVSVSTQMLEKMTLEEKIGQMFIVAYRKDNSSNITQLNGYVEESVKKYRPGGVALFSENIENYEQVKEFIADLQGISDIPLIIGTDEEGGSVSRLKNIINTLPRASEIGKANNAENTYLLAAELASKMADLGFNMNFAPVCDIDQRLNSVVGSRAFGNTPETVSIHSAEIIKGLQDNGIGAVAKHFPGHGGTREDSHLINAVTDASLDELLAFELVPFENAVKIGVAAIMAGHISVPEVTGNNEPVIFSSYLLTDVLRDKMNFNGLIITDAMEMGAVSKYYTQEEAAVKAVIAGVDIILMPSDLDAAYTGLLNAALNGDISMEKIDSSVKRILDYKYDFVFKNSYEY